MKMTMHIDDALLANVVRITGAASKTEAVHLALREMDRKARLAEFGRNGIGMSRAELMDAVMPGYDVLALRNAEAGAADSPRVMDEPPPVSIPLSYREYARRRRNSRA